jgi:hypothetical protein
MEGIASHKGKVNIMKKFGAPQIFTVVLIVVMALALWRSTKFPFLAAAFPAVVCIVVILCGILSLTRHLLGKSTLGGVMDIVSDTTLPAAERRKKAYRAFGWIILLYLISALVGFKLGALIFMTGYVAIEARARWQVTTILTAGTLVILVVFHQALRVWWDEGWLGLYLVDYYPWLF